MPAPEQANSSRPRWKIIAVAFVLLLIAGTLFFFFLRGQRRASPSRWGNGQRVILQLCGSNTMGSELAPALVRAFLERQGATGVEVRAGEKADEQDVEGKLAGHNIPSVVQIKAHGSATAFTGLGDRSCDIGMASRKIEAEEAARLATLGDMTSPASEYVLASGQIGIIVNRSNPLISIKREQLAKIFEGGIVNWAAVRGAGSGEIHIYARDDNSGTWETFRRVVMGGGELAPSARRFENSASLSAAVASDRNGIGFVGMPFVRKTKAIALTSDGDALSRSFYLYVPQNPENIYTRKFITFASSSAGQRIVRAKGFEPVPTAAHSLPRPDKH